MIYLFDKDEKLIKIVRKSAVKTALQKYALTTERYVSDRLTVELKGLNADELEQVEYMAIQTMEDAHAFHYFYVAQKSSDELTTLIGVQSGIEELRKSPVYDKRPQNAFARDVITDLLAGTNWQARFVGETTPHSTNFYYTSVFDALKKVCEVWDLEMQFFVEMNGNRIGARYIDFKQRIGEAVGKRVVYGHNALQILQEVERTNIFTALIGRGKGEETGSGYGRKITFEDVTWSTDQGKPVNKPKGQKYLELPLMTRQYGIKNADGSMRPKIGFVDFSEEENPEVLIERTYRALIDAARPQLTLKTSSVYLRGVKVGDTIRVVRHDKKLDYDTRIFEITFNRLNNQSSDIKLGDRIGESNEAKAQTIADKAVEQFVNNEFSNFVQNLPDYLPSADGFNNNWYGAEDPTVKYPGKVLINDIWYKPDPEHEGHKIMLRWTGEVWEEILRTYESEALRDRIAEEITQINQSMQAQAQEHDRQVANILSKTQSVESLANQAKSDAASALARANQAKTEAITDARAQVATVSQALNTAKSELQSAIASADQKARDSQASATALRNDLNVQASKVLEQAQAQTALTSRVTTVETLADGTKTTVAELSKIVNKATGDIASVTSRTKTVEDTLTQTRTQYEALTQTVNAQTGQIESINRKTADLQSGIDGVTERFENLRVGSVNYIRDFGFAKNHNFSNNQSSWRFERIEDGTARSGYHIKATCTQSGGGGFHRYLIDLRGAVWQGRTMTYSVDIKASKSVRMRLGAEAFNKGYKAFDVTTEWQRFISTDTVNFKTYYSYPFYADSITWAVGDVVYLRDPQLEDGNLATTPHAAEEDLRSEFATYVRTATENSAELVKRIETADGKAVDAKSYAQQTAEVIDTRLESLETYKNEEGTRASQYLTASRAETAKQITAERTAIANDYVAKSTYDENVRGTTLKLNEVKTTADTAKQNLASYQNTVDRKLEELTSSTQTLDGKIDTASTKVDTVAGQIRTEIGTVEAKIPTEVGGRNYILKSQAEISSTGRWVSKPFNLSSDLLSNLSKIRTVTISCDVEGINVSALNSRKRFGLACPVEINGVVNHWEVWQTEDTAKKRISQTFTVPEGKSITKFYFPTLWIQSEGNVKVSNPKLEFGRVPTDHTLAPEDLIDELSSVKTTITQTARGVEQLSTSLSATDNKVTTAEAQIRNLVDEVSSKVSQTDYNTLTGRVENTETAITQNATEISKRLTKTQVDEVITDKGYQTKSDVDSNITGRGYITSSALQPYALSTTVQNLVKETSDSFSRTISETRALIPTSAGGRNYILKSQAEISSTGRWVSKPFNLSSDLLSNLSKIRTVTISCDVEGINVSALNSRKRFGLACPVEINGVVNHWEVWQTEDTAKKRISQTFTVPEGKSITKFYFPTLWIQSEGNVKVSNPKLEFGRVPTDHTLAPEDIATVTALHNVTDTVDSHTRTIGAVGETGSILDNVSKVTQTAAGLIQEVSGTNGLKTQVSTLAGSWAVKNLTNSGTVLNQLNLNKDGSVKIDGSLVQITGKTYIQDGVITSAKIGKGQIGTAHIGEIDAGIAKIINLDVSNIKGLDAEFIKAKIENAFIGWMKGKTIAAQNEAMTIGLNDAFIRFKDNAKIEFQSENNTLYRTKNGTSAFIHFRDDSYNGVYTAMGVNADNTGTQNDYSSGTFAGVRVIRSNPSRYSGTTVDQVQLVGDEIRIRHGHGYENDYLVIKWDNQGRIDLIKFLRSVASKLGLPLT
ncbi:phage tail spike protein [Streptococcus sp. SS-4456]|uniref:phage tail spike protein n=1 Tax=Streptococcus sp. SS-4456 TaxID=3072286 RepID=UPI002FCB4950